MSRLSPARVHRELSHRLVYRWGPRLASELRRRWLLATHPHAHIEFRGSVHLGPGFSLHIPDGGSFIVGHGVEFRRGFRAEIAGDGRIEIGDLTTFTYDTLIQCSTQITIGKRCAIGQAVLLVDGNHRFRDPDRPFLDQGYDFRPIRVGDDAAITSKATVVADVGDHAWVAANAVVTRDVPPFTLVGGVPARVIEYFGPPGQEPPGFEASSNAST
ncbi:MAG: acyltransferase [Solirubrobacterales bacterium]